MAPSKSGSGVGQVQIHRVTVNHDREGFSCCGVCRVCTCIKWGFVFSPLGVIKMTEIVSLFFI